MDGTTKTMRRTGIARRAPCCFPGFPAPMQTPGFPSGGCGARRCGRLSKTERTRGTQPWLLADVRPSVRHSMEDVIAPRGWNAERPRTALVYFSIILPIGYRIPATLSPIRLVVVCACVHAKRTIHIYIEREREKESLIDRRRQPLLLLILL